MKKTLFLITLNLLFINLISGATIFVTNTNNSGAGSLRQAELDASNGDTIRFDPSLISTGSATITLTSQITSTKGLVYKGLYNATDTLYVSGGGTSGVFRINANPNPMYVDSMVLINGNFSQGGAILFVGSASLYVANSIFIGNNASIGGAIQMSQDYPFTVDNCRFINNTASGIGGAINTYLSNGIILNSYFEGNSSIGRGGAIHNETNGIDSVFVQNCTFENNTSQLGGAIYSRAPRLIINNSDFQNNSVSNNGGAICMSDLGAYVDINNSTFSTNSAGSSGRGGAIYTFNGAISNCTFNDNQALIGGGFACENTAAAVDITNSTFYANQAQSGGGLSSTGIVNIKNTTITGNVGVANSGIDVRVGSTINSSIIAGNTGAPTNINNVNFTSLGYNIFEDSLTITSSISSDQKGLVAAANLNLQALGNYGGTTKTLQPQYPSIAINKGNPSDLLDAQNLPVRGGIRDVGAAESCVTVSTMLVDACDSYTWALGDGNNYSSTTTEEYLTGVSNQYGCDSLLILNLVVTDLPINQTTTVADIFFCDNGTTTVDIASSENNVKYWLRNDVNDTIIDGPFDGDGNAITFNTGSINQTMTYNVFAEKDSDYGIQFNKANLDRIEYNPVYNTFSDQITLEAWIKFDNTTNDDLPWMGQSTVNTDDLATNVWIWHAASGGTAIQFYVNDNGNWRNTISGSITGLNGWHHVATVADASGTYIYIDGVQSGPAGPGIVSGIRNNSASTLFIGGDSRFVNNGSRHGSYGIGEFRMWSISKSITDIQNDMNSCLFGNEAGLEILTKFNEGSGTTASSVIGNDGNFSTGMTLSSWIDGNNVCVVASGCGFEMLQTLTVTVGQSNSGSATITECSSYTWSANSTNYTMNGTYVETLTNASGCDSVATLNLTINQPNTGIDVVEACDSLTWLDGITYSISNTTATYTLTNSLGCDSVVTLNLSINDSPVLSATFMDEISGGDGSIDLTVSGGTPTYVFDWDNDGTGDYDDTEDLTSLTSGTYTVIVKDINGCDDTLIQVIQSFVSIEENEKNRFVVFPNPTSGSFSVEFEKVITDLKLTIIDARGKVILSTYFESSTHVDGDLTGLPSGIYTLLLEGLNLYSNFRLVKE